MEQTQLPPEDDGAKLRTYADTAKLRRHFSPPQSQNARMRAASVGHVDEVVILLAALHDEVLATNKVVGRDDAVSVL